MRFKIYTIVMILGFTVSSCESFLEEENKSGLTSETFYSTVEGIESLVNSCYTPLRFWYGKENGIALSELGTDIFTRGNGMENPPVALYNSDLSGANAPLGFYWERFYSALNTCNAAVNRIPSSPLSEALRKTREGEVRFLRALYLWHIVETWGGVHFTLEETKAPTSIANRTSVDKFYEQIFSDLQLAIDNLPATTNEYGRATKPAAEAFAARMHLTRGNYQEASTLARNVIEKYNFSLVPRYSDLWSIDNIKNPEAIFVVNFNADLILNKEFESLTLRDGGNNSHLFFLMTYDQIVGMQRDITNGRPFARFMPTVFLLDLFNENMDSRYNVTFQNVWFSNKPGTYTINNGTTDDHKVSVTYKAGDTAILATKYVIPLQEKLAKKYTVIDRSRTYAADGTPIVRDRYISLRKFLDPSRLTISQQQGKRDPFVLRLAEMYLIVAEAEMYLQNLSDAKTYIDAVRRRAALPGKAADMEVKEEDINIDFILDERAREFAGEQLRWFDLKRTNKLVDRVQAHNPDAASNIQSYHMVRPIPQAQLDAVSNKGEFTQNQGYQ